MIEREKFLRVRRAVSLNQALNLAFNNPADPLPPSNPRGWHCLDPNCKDGDKCQNVGHAFDPRD